jgi:Holliday junction resolvasome RuvABC endonuclease subunit
MRILGIDPGNPTGVVILDTEQQQVVYHETFNGRTTTALLTIAQQLETVFRNLTYDVVAVEKPHGTYHNALRSLSEHVGVCRYLAYVYGNKPLYKVTPAEGKQTLTGKGNATADEMIDHAHWRYGAVVDEHVAHAIGYAFCAESMLLEDIRKQQAKASRRKKKVPA